MKMHNMHSYLVELSENEFTVLGLICKHFDDTMRNDKDFYEFCREHDIAYTTAANVIREICKEAA